MNCLAIVVAFFAQMHAPLPSLPSVIVTQEIDRPGYYRDGVVYVKPDADCAVYAHEAMHHAQHERGGDAKDGAEWERREADAHKWELIFRESR